MLDPNETNLNLGNTGESTPDLPIVASRGARLGASLIDTLILAVILVPTMYLTGGFDGLAQKPPVEPSLAYQLMMLALSVGLYCAINWRLLEQRGQTVGKKIMGIAIVHLDNSKPTARDILIKRYLPYILPPYIPVVGNIISLVGVLMIFGQQRRCLHDLIAGTKVVYAVAESPSFQG